MELSDCCGAPLKTEGVPDFIGSSEVITIHYRCSKCNKPCNLQKELKCPYCKGKLKIKGFIVLSDAYVECEDCQKVFLQE